ncbi:MAG: SPFH domain-containing protein [Lachnospiraceae bacterium]|nr:SPFH domain-containing protein [Lachnospiraceae bacterium]
MGLIKAVLKAGSSVLADQWKDYFYCDSLSKDVLVVKGQRKTGAGSQNKGNDNIISNGSGIAVNEGQCMIIVEQGKVVEICAEPGQFTWDSSSEPSIFCGSLENTIVDTFKTFVSRITLGGDTGKDQRIYYFNIKEIIDNKFGTANPVPFRVVDRNIGLDIDVNIRCSGVFSYKITDPILFYTNVCGNVTKAFTRQEIDAQLKTEFISALQPAMGKLSDLQIRPNQIVQHTTELEQALNDALSAKWSKLRGISVVSVAIGSVSLPDEDAELIKNAQKAAIMRDPTMAAANLVGAQADAMRAAANNTAGAFTGFMGMNMASQAGGMNAQSLYAMGQAMPAQPKTENGWKCSCGAYATGNFCPECGSRKLSTDGWTCSCGTVNKGKFCQNCGSKKPAGIPLYKCDKCGWEPEDPKNPPKFCPECGDRFTDEDIINK